MSRSQHAAPAVSVQDCRIPTGIRYTVHAGTVVRLHLPIVASNASCSVSNIIRLPASSATARSQNTDRPISPARAPRVRTWNTSVLHRMSPSRYTSAVPAPASTTCGHASMMGVQASRPAHDTEGILCHTHLELPHALHVSPGMADAYSRGLEGPWCAEISALTSPGRLCQDACTL
jgi:hypothetical protein